MGTSLHSGLVIDATGNLFGTAHDGFSHNFGGVYQIASGSGTYSNIAAFDNLTNGAYPNADLTVDAVGNLYGTTVNGGTGQNGTVFKIAAGSHMLSTVAKLNGTNGSTPEGAVTVDSAGNIFGTTAFGGGKGTAFEIPAGTSTVLTLAAFNGSNGANPFSSLVADSSGNLFGTTKIGGLYNDGTVFEITAGTRSLITLVNFSGTDGQNPYAAPIVDAAGNLFGTTFAGGANGVGTIYEFKPATNTFTTLADFSSAVAVNPYAGLTPDTAGNLFGVTVGAQAPGGFVTGSAVFELTGSDYTVVPEPASVVMLTVLFPTLLRCRKARSSAC